MGASIVLLISLTASLSLAEKQKSHDIWLTKIDKPEVNPEWVTEPTYKLKKISTHGKALEVNSTLLKAIDNDDIMCEVNVFQKSGGKYMKAPANLAPTPCCKIMRNNENNIWPCIRMTSNFPKECPIPAGEANMKAFNPNDCTVPDNLPPRLPEEYKIVFTGSLNSVMLWKYVAYGVIKKRI